MDHQKTIRYLVVFIHHKDIREISLNSCRNDLLELCTPPEPEVGGGGGGGEESEEGREQRGGGCERVH